jgi:hypothetical protein
MKEVTGNLWDYPADWRCITTNGRTRSDGALVMGRGCAKEATERFPGLEFACGDRVRARGNIVQSVAKHRLILFPVKDSWEQPAKLGLIERSAIRLAEITEEHDLGTVVLPRPGCGNGRLSWADVQPSLARILPDSVHVITFK